MKRNKIKLPPFTVEKVVSAMSEIVDWGLEMHNVPKVWETTMGEDVNVYILDTAGETEHQDLVGNFIGGINFSSSKTLKDAQGHGHHCAGIIAAEKNDTGCIGVAPKAKIFLVKVLNDSGSGSATSIENGLKFCYERIGKEDGPDIISMSLGADGPLGVGCEKWIKKLYDANIPVICAAGNSGREGVNYPAKYKETIAIGAFDRNGNLAKFSTTGEEVAVAAPGVDIYSTWPPNSYARLSGTSMATPFIAGIVALLIAKHRKQEKETGLNDCKTVEDIRTHLVKHCIDKGQLGKDKQWGYGVIDLENLIKN